MFSARSENACLAVRCPPMWMLVRKWFKIVYYVMERCASISPWSAPCLGGPRVEAPSESWREVMYFNPIINAAFKTVALIQGSSVTYFLIIIGSFSCKLYDNAPVTEAGTRKCIVVVLKTGLN